MAWRVAVLLQGGNVGAGVIVCGLLCYCHQARVSLRGWYVGAVGCVLGLFRANFGRC